nr:hypothetical protein [Candidatus Sigynarchaeota archaeon]
MKGKSFCSPDRDGEYYRTYKTSLRQPESLLEPIRNAAIEHETCQRLLKFIGGNFDDFCRVSKKFSHTDDTKLEVYQQVFVRLNGKKRAELEHVLAENGKKFEWLKRKDATLRSGTLTKDNLPRIADPERPLPSEISPADYNYLAATSIEYLCKTANLIVKDAITKLPPDKDAVIKGAAKAVLEKGCTITEGSLRAYPAKAIEHFLGKSSASNLEQLVYKQGWARLGNWVDIRKKIQDVHDKFAAPCGLVGDEPDVSSTLPVLVYSYWVPRYLQVQLAWKWNVDASWVRNTLVGWRRKVDEFLPVPCQVEPLAGLFEALAVHARSFTKTKEEREVIGILQKKHVLHLLGERLNFRPLLKSCLHGALHSINLAFTRWPVDLQARIDAHVTRIDASTFVTAAKELALDVQRTIASQEPGSNGAIASTTFLHKVEFLEQQMTEMAPFLSRYIPGNRYTSSISTLLSSLEAMRESGMAEFRNALRGIVASAFATVHPDATARLLDALIPDNCATRPYMSSMRKRDTIPIELHMNKYVVPRKSSPTACNIVDGKEKEAFLTNEGMTTLMRDGKPVWLGIPIYTPDQYDPQRGILDQRRRMSFWYQVVPTKAVIERLQRGAAVQLLRIHPPSPGSRKIEVDIVLSAPDRRPFKRSTKFIATMDAVHGTKDIPKGFYLCNDLNELGKNVIAVGTETNRIDLVLLGMMKEFSDIKDRIDNCFKEMALVQGAIDRGKGSPGKQRRRKVQHELLGKCIKNLKAQADKAVVLLYAYMAYRTGAKHVGWDGVEVMTRGTRGRLAKAVALMPKRKDLKDECSGLFMDLQDAGFLSSFQMLHITSPYTSQVCDACFAKTGIPRQSRDPAAPYQEFWCNKCGVKVTRHLVSARSAALFLQRDVEKRGKSIA